MVWGSGGKYDTWWDRNPIYVHGINFLPFTGGSLYLGRRPDYVRRNYQALFEANRGEPRLWRDIIWMFQALGDPERALAQYRANPHFETEFGVSRAFVYQWLHALASFGQVDTTITADSPTYAVLRAGSTRHHVALNPGRPAAGGALLRRRRRRARPLRAKGRERPVPPATASPMSLPAQRSGLVPAFLLSACGSGAGETGAWQLVWSDEFDGATGAPPDPGKVEPRSRRARLGQPGAAVLHRSAGERRPRRQPAFSSSPPAGRSMGSRAFTSARLSSKGKLEQAYGRFEARLKLPAGKGFWPAFWMLGADFDRVGWPACGEIDVVESRGAQPWRVSGALHGPGYSGGNALVGAFETPERTRFSDDFHTYAVEWEPDEIRFFVDENLFHTVRPTRLPPGTRWPYDHPFFLLLNLAVGGNFGGPPDATTPFPQTLSADWVRVYPASASWRARGGRSGTCSGPWRWSWRRSADRWSRQTAPRWRPVGSS